MKGKFIIYTFLVFTWCWKKVLSCSRSKCKLQMYFGEHLSNLFWKGIFTIWDCHTQFKSWQQLRDNAAKIINYLKKCTRHDNVSYWKIRTDFNYLCFVTDPANNDKTNIIYWFNRSCELSRFIIIIVLYIKHNATVAVGGQAWHGLSTSIYNFTLSKPLKRFQIP